MVVELGPSVVLATFQDSRYYCGQFAIIGVDKVHPLPKPLYVEPERKPVPIGKAPEIRLNTTGGGALTDVYEKDFKQMEEDGEPV